MSPRSGGRRTSPPGTTPSIDDLPPELRTLMHDLRADGFDLLGRVRPIHEVVERQIAVFDRLQDGGLTVTDIAELLMRPGIVGPDGKRIRDGTLRSALSRARKITPSVGKAADRNTRRHRAAASSPAQPAATGGSHPPPAAAERVEPQPRAATRAKTTLVAAASHPAQPIETHAQEERSPVQLRADLWNNASRS